jgi:multisubunit Na+/H+ antiporter MnhC subunit
MTYHDRPNPGWAGVVIGLMIIGLGVALFLDQTGWLGWRPSWSLWPFLLIGLGLARFATPRDDGSREGGWLIFIGVWLLLNSMHVLRIRDSWPLLLVAIGVNTIWKTFARRTPPNTPQVGQGS